MLSAIQPLSGGGAPTCRGGEASFRVPAPVCFPPRWQLPPRGQWGRAGPPGTTSFLNRLSSPPRPPSLDQLRAERLQREAAERARAQALLARIGGTAAQEDQPEEVDDRRRRYNSQFNPQLARRPRQQERPLAH